MSKSVHYRLPEELIERMRLEAKKYSVTMTDIVIFAIQEYLKLRGGVQNE